MINIKGRSVFLSGPMSGLDYCNVDEFARAHAIVKEAGAYEVYNPAVEYLLSEHGANDMPHSYWMRRCINELTSTMGPHDIFGDKYADNPKYSVLVLLPGWEDSDGVRTEREVALACGMMVCELGDVG